jgi:hypothetical protein
MWDNMREKIGHGPLLPLVGLFASFSAPWMRIDLKSTIYDPFGKIAKGRWKTKNT